jgi:hypothetical protein
MNDVTNKQYASGTGTVELVKENKDGSAVYLFDFPAEALEALTRFGILNAILAGIDKGQELNPENCTSKKSSWVGLTDQERAYLRKRNQKHDEYAKAVEKLLREKNT